VKTSINNVNITFNKTKLKLTGYKANAPPNAVRVPLEEDLPNFHHLISGVVQDLSDDEFDAMEKELRWFWLSAHGEHIAIYFWIEQD
jgi:hypothetical protein